MISENGHSTWSSDITALINDCRPPLQRSSSTLQLQSLPHALAHPIYSCIADRMHGMRTLPRSAGAALRPPLPALHDRMQVYIVHMHMHQRSFTLPFVVVVAVCVSFAATHAAAPACSHAHTFLEKLQNYVRAISTREFVVRRCPPCRAGVPPADVRLHRATLGSRGATVFTFQPTPGAAPRRWQK